MSIACAGPFAEAAAKAEPAIDAPSAAATFEHPPAIAPASSGRLRDAGLSAEERNWGIVLHLSPLGAGLAFSVGFLPALVLPLVLWLVRKNHSAFNDDAGREVTNYCITFLLLNILLGITIIGVVFIPVLWVIGVVSVIRGAVAASRGEYFRYPMTWRFLS